MVVVIVFLKIVEVLVLGFMVLFRDVRVESVRLRDVEG